MIKPLFVLFILGVFSKSSCLVLEHNCSTEEPTNRSDQCIFQCIESVFDKKYCSSCGTGARTIPVKLRTNETLTSLAQHHEINYDEEIHTLRSKCTDCQNEPSGDHLMEAYSKSMDIDRFINCTRNTTQANCTETDARKMFEKLSERFNAPQKWCIDALGINEQMKKIDNSDVIHNSSKEIFLSNATESPTHEQIEVSNDDTSTTSGIENSTTEKNEETTYPPTMSTTGENSNDERSSTAPIPTETSTQTTNSTSKPTAKIRKNNRPQPPEEHHYTSSITIIVMIAILILTILVITFIVLRTLVNRRKRLQMRSSSCTYVFDSQK